MKVLLIDLPWYRLKGMSTAPLPLGLGYLAKHIKRRGHDCRIFCGDFTTEKNITHEKVIEISNKISLSKNINWVKFIHKLISIIKDYKPNIIGITVPTAKYAVASETIKIINKNFPQIKVVLGGPHPTISPDSCFNIGRVNFLVRGEGEDTFLDLLKNIENKKSLANLRGISYMKGNRVVNNKDRELITNLDKLSFPDWTLCYDYESMPSNLFGTMIASRGCPYNCIFCASKKIWTLKTRYRSPQNIFNEITQKKRQFGTDFFNFNDDSFTLRKQEVIKFCNLIITNKVKINWACDTRVNLVDKEMLSKMKEAGCVQVRFGIECGNDKMLKYIKKGITLDHVKRAFTLAKKIGINTLAYFMMGFPEEKKEDIIDTLQLMKSIQPDYPCWSIVTPYPGTELYDICIREGLIDKNIDWSEFQHHSDKMGVSKYIKREDFKSLAQKIERITFLMKIKYYLARPIKLLKDLKII